MTVIGVPIAEPPILIPPPLIEAGSGPVVAPPFPTVLSGAARYPSTRSYPFRRLGVDHLVVGNSRIWWQLEENFKEPGPHVFQLQFGHTDANNALDWEHVGLPQTNGYYAIDPVQRDFGTLLTAHYRVAVTTPTGKYVSLPIHCLGELPEKDWLEAREIIRKEQLRMVQMAGVEGVLLRQIRYGTKCPRCLDTLTGGVLDSACTICGGTGFKRGYHPPVPFVCFDLQPQAIAEKQSPQQGSTDARATLARAIAFPMVSKFDVWVNCKSDERWYVDKIQHLTHVRNVPVVSQLTLAQAAFSDPVYEVSLSVEDDQITLPGPGTGSVAVTQDYSETNHLAYVTAMGVPILGATVLVFTAAVYQATYPGRPTDDLALASVQTDANGGFTTPLWLDPGDYVLIYRKPPEYGPDLMTLQVLEPSSGSSSSVSSSSNSFW